ncbi:hypothetical protein HN51_024224 [Arachis hypogaea]|uniref:Protein kinase domain-containing protein n=2 Tax=Arachis TaxID=3817 RepID=A0A445C5A3_ARAHY|nr:probable inactive receptor-like protein kinase At3g56050 [Arachis duranensis]XP_025609126.1 probable inactive receptor-like protein kinase At3g56050 [Arachis hypogaea]QHO27249.1 uncharacterized protein DS421_7g206360 [Arachis hypogaea]QHO27250.1 uncharacterized protein DS421_7g206360 [Arachis hypogaea]RYR46061.1 hypothetical protein Ahy_A07g031821 [Arachis hypogaea]
MSKSLKLRWFMDFNGVLRFAVVVCLLLQNLGFCYTLNEEGKALLKLRERIVSDPFGALSNWYDDEAVFDPCNWFGVECSDGRVVALNLKDLCLGGTLAPELVNLVHLKSIILRNNSLSGIIPKEIEELKELEVLDLGYNNLSGHIPIGLGSNISLSILLLDNNEFLVSFTPEIDELKMLSESQVDKKQLVDAAKRPACTTRSFSWDVNVDQNTGIRSLLQSPISKHFHAGKDSYNRVYNQPLSSPASSPASPRQNASNPPPSKSEVTSRSSTSKNHRVPVEIGVIGGAALLLITCIGIFLCKINKVTNVRPWATGLSGQLQKAFVTGVPKLKRTEIEAACEDFSNVIGTSPIGTMYKGTLSSGVEIAVASVSVTSSKDWSRNLEAQFRNKIDMLSKVNHRNFVNLIGYCDEEEPFTRMMVFEYAPNGTLFEHLHIREAEHLDWETRLRIAAGTAYCLQHLHQLEPSMTLTNLNSSVIHLTEDNAAKISDFSFSYETASAETKSWGKRHIDMAPATLESNVHSFGTMLLEMVTGKACYSVDSINGLIENWATQYLEGDEALKEVVDPTLACYQDDQLEQVAALIKCCCNSESEKRPTMKQVSVRLREITKLAPEAAVPRLSPLWWAELEISNADAI